MLICRSLRLGGADLLPKCLQAVPNRYDDYTVSVTMSTQTRAVNRSTIPTTSIHYDPPLRVSPRIGSDALTLLDARLLVLWHHSGLVHDLIQQGLEQPDGVLVPLLSDWILPSQLGARSLAPLHERQQSRSAQYRF